MPQAPFPLSPSLWAATAAAPPPTEPLGASTQADVLVVGGGYAGLSTALHLAERGVRVVLLEAREIGFGGSGRNGGQVIPGLKYDPDALIAMFGAERGERLVRFAGATADTVFNLIERHAMDVPFVRKGWIQGAHTAQALRLAHGRAAEWAKLGADVEPLDRAQVAGLIGTDRYLGGWVDRRAGAIQPLSYARGLARAALDAGAVSSIRTRPSPAWRARAANGRRPRPAARASPPIGW